jgi:hypothetical protein
MINWQKLVGEKGVVLLNKPFLLIGQVNQQLIPLGQGPQGNGQLGPEAPNPQVTQFLEVIVTVYDKDTSSLTLTYDSPIALPGVTRQRLEVTLDAGTIEYFIKANKIELVPGGGFVGPDGKPLA